MSKVKAITPDEVMENLPDYIPDAIIEAVNFFLTKECRGKGMVRIKQKDIVAKAVELDNTLTPTKIYDEKYMDFESIFEAAGWKVSYDKPAYNETYDALFEFEKK